MLTKKQIAILKKKKPRPKEKVLIREVRQIKEKKVKSGIIKTKSKFQLGYGCSTGSKEDAYTIIDDTYSLKTGSIEEITIQKTNLSPKFKKEFGKSAYDQMTKEGMIRGELVRRVNSYNVPSILRFLDANGVGSKWLRYLIDDGDHKDERIIELAMAHSIYLPNDHSWQGYNGHSIIITNPSTGKSGAYERLGQPLKVDFSEAGALGSFDFKDGGRLISGSLEGNGIYFLDEFTEIKQKDYNFNFVDTLLSYLENGKIERDLAYKVVLKGTKTLVFCSNPEGIEKDPNPYSLYKALQSLSDKNKTYSRISKRIPILYFGNDFKVISFKPANDELADAFCLGLYRDIMIYHYKEIGKMLEKSRKYTLKNAKIPEGVEEEINRCIRYCRYQSLKELLKGYKLGAARIMMTGFRYAIAKNINKVILNSSKNTFEKIILPEALKQTNKFWAYNLRSFSYLIDPVLVDLDKLMKHGFDEKEIKSKLIEKHGTYWSGHSFDKDKLLIT